MRWLVAFYLLNAMLHYFTDDSPAKATFWIIGAVLFVLMEIANNVRDGQKNP